MSKVIIYTTRNGVVEIVVPAPKSLAYGRRVLTAHKSLVYPGVSGPDFNDLPQMIDVSQRRWSVIDMQFIAKKLKIAFTPTFITLETEDTCLVRLQKSVLPKGAVNVQRVEADKVPTDRVFRDAWAQDTTGDVTTDMGKARDIHMDRIKKARGKKFAELDVEWSKLTGQKNGPAADAIEAKRQALRDLPDKFDLSGYATPEELFEAWPEELDARVIPGRN